MSRVIVPEQQPFDINRDGHTTLGELVTSMLVIWGLLFAGLTVTIGGLLLLVELRWSFRICAANVVLATVAASIIGLWRMLRYERAERAERIERQRRHAFEDWEYNLKRGIVEREENTRYTQADIDAAALLVLRLHYNGEEWSREACERDRTVKPDLWNEVNRLFQTRGIRRSRSKRLEPETFADAWAAWCQAKLETNSLKRHRDEFVEAE